MYIFLVILLLAAVFTDSKYGKIPNLLTLTGSITGIFMTKHLSDSILQALFVIIVFFPFYIIKSLGAGDIKCIAMASLYLTPEQFLNAVLYTFLIAAAISLIKIIQVRSQNTDTISLRNITIHLAFPIFMGVFLSIGGDLLCIIS